MRVSTRVVTTDILHILLAQQELGVTLLSVLVRLGDLNYVSVLAEGGYSELDDEVDEGAGRDEALANDFE